MTSPRYEQLKETLLNQFQDSENFLKLFEILAEPFDEIDSILSDLALKTWSETAGGVWLDYRGGWVGLPDRPNKTIPSGNIFTVRDLASPDDALKGVSSLVSPSGGYLAGGAGSFIEEEADDDEFRLYIKAKEFSTDVAPTIKNIVIFCETIVGVEVTVEQPQTGLIVVNLLGSYTTTQKNIIKTLAPLLGTIKLRTNPI